MRVLLLGAGYSARAVARLIAGDAEWIAGTTRTKEMFGPIGNAGIRPILFDGTAISDGLADAMASATHLVHSAAPGNDGDPLLQLLPDGLAEAMPTLKWAGYFSTVGVYGNHDGAVVDEESPCLATAARGLARIEAERAWLEAGESARIPVAVMRLAGIYGPGRNPFKKLEADTARRIIKKGQAFSRIHVDDIAAATHHLLLGGRGGIFNFADNEPAPSQDVIAYAAGLMGIEPPPEIPFEQAEMTPMARSFYADNRRISNAKLRASGFEFLQPTYREALAAMWADDSWRGAE